MTFSPAVVPSPNYSPPKCGSRATGTIMGLGDNKPHGWHVHEFGDISGSDGTSTGGHFNPEGVDHALPGNGGGHLGDLGNLMPDGHGTAHVNQDLRLETKEIVGRGLIVHAAEDDGGQPTGNAGARLGMCVLGIADSGK